MRFVPFYEDYLQVVVLGKLAEVVATKNPTSLADFRRKFNEYYGLNISYDQFRNWVRDLGISVEHQAQISIPGQEHAPPLAPSDASPPLEAEYDIPPRRRVATQEPPPRPQPQPQPMQGAGPPSRGGINLEELFRR
jgi:hypothetical protein